MADIFQAVGMGGGAGGDHAVQLSIEGLDPAEAEVVNALGREPRHVDEIARALGQSAGGVAAALMMLEMKGRVRQVGGASYVLA